MNKILILLFVITVLSCQTQQTEKFNLGFENQKEINNLSDGWFKWGNYDLTIDTLSHSGKKSGKITSDHLGNSFGSIVYKIPANYKGKSIRLEGYMKIQNVENGFAGLLLRIDGNNGPLEMDNMGSHNIQGTKDWQKYSITFDYSEKAKTIFVA
ncbi:MAG: hypothetical protein WBM91_06845 [Eudoraea sp.]|uniref:hypothetical protein n=1 Tax=Eudoraea sp. TaxID=1979955 RepID=UPI003C74C3CA